MMGTIWGKSIFRRDGINIEDKDRQVNEENSEANKPK